MAEIDVNIVSAQSLEKASGITTNSLIMMVPENSNTVKIMTLDQLVKALQPAIVKTDNVNTAFATGDKCVMDAITNLYNGKSKKEDWKTLTLNSPFKAYSTGSDLKYRKIGNRVILQGILTTSTVVTGSNTTALKDICTLPVGYRPMAEIFSVTQGSSAYRWLMTIKTDGRVGANRYGEGSSMINIPSGVWLPIYMEFTVDA